MSNENQQNEYIIYRFWPMAILSRPTWLVAIVLGLLALFKSVLFALFLFAVGFVLATLAYLNAKDDHIVVSSNYIRRVQRAAFVFGWSEDTINPRHVQSVTLQQGMLQKMFNTGTIVIETAGEQPFEFPDVLNARQSVEIIRRLAFQKTA